MADNVSPILMPIWYPSKNSTRQYCNGFVQWRTTEYATRIVSNPATQLCRRETNCNACKVRFSPTWKSPMKKLTIIANNANAAGDYIVTGGENIARDSTQAPARPAAVPATAMSACPTGVLATHAYARMTNLSQPQKHLLLFWLEANLLLWAAPVSLDRYHLQPPLKAET